MSFKFPLLAGVAALAFALPAFADGIMVHDPYARASAAMSQSGAAFMEIMNQTDTDDRLIDARSDVAERVELHTHQEDANGVMRMIHVEEGFAIAAGETHALARGGDHVMFLGLTRELAHGDELELTLVFEQAGEVTITVPVDLERNPMRQQMQGTGQMNHGAMGNAASD
jgi:copper(I)-binding protein